MTENIEATETSAPPLAALETNDAEKAKRERFATFAAAAAQPCAFVQLDAVRFAASVAGLRAIERAHGYGGDWIAENIASMAKANSITPAQLIDAAGLLTLAATK